MDYEANQPKRSKSKQDNINSVPAARDAVGKHAYTSLMPRICARISSRELSQRPILRLGAHRQGSRSTLTFVLGFIPV